MMAEMGFGKTSHEKYFVSNTVLLVSFPPLFFFVVLGFEFRAYTLSHSTSTFCDGFF
jgi:hypothetical protein